MRHCFAPLLGLFTSCAVAGAPESAAGAGEAIERVFSDFNSCKVDDLVARYSADNIVFFTGSTAKPVASRAELIEYFGYLTSEPCSSPAMPKHSDIKLQVRPIGSSAAIVHANTVVKFVSDGTAQARPFFFTFVLQESSGRWLVISQNAHAVPKE
jgi:hypothetical protein